MLNVFKYKPKHNYIFLIEFSLHVHYGGWREGGGGPGRRRMSAYPSGSCASVALGSNVSPKLDRWKEIMDTPLAPQRFRDDDTSLTCLPTQGRTLSTLKRKIYCKNHYWPLPLVLMYCSFIFSVVCREWNPSPQIESHKIKSDSERFRWCACDVPRSYRHLKFRTFLGGLLLRVYVYMEFPG